MKKVYIVSAKRTAIGSFLGSLKTVEPAELGGRVIKSIIEETGVDPKNIDEVILGNVLSAGHGQGVGRQAAVAGGIPYEVPAYSVNIICGSGMKALMNGVNNIRAGEGDLILAGGVESMSQAGFVAPAAIRNGHKMMDLKMTDHMIKDGLTDAFNGYHMGITAENIVEKYSLTREEQDAFAMASQEKAIAAVDSDRFKDEIVPVEIVTRRETIVFDRDEYPNRRTSLEKLAGLRPAFKKDGSVTAGNSSGLNDGASIVLLASEEAVEKYNLKPLAEVAAIGQGGVDPSIMGMGPVPAINNLLSKTDVKLADVELFELNEAFASQSLGVVKELSKQHGVTEEWIRERSNVNGGAIALGHPIGASGNRIITTLVHEMVKRDSKSGIASLCIGGGMGTAILLKR
ncbi:acetyl-CoA acetyltransferase [Propionigenium maris DSM 9537]|uniref:Acetyl-CoA acetyltransferase n=1 Tax=Propionigenium maris DSM 9537 TaxID=1123000 RepID=A0A9W6LNV4_9FUSO|nr:acetyl-CoA C-acetyltransferase [Propionigenium maris]GLI56330.1 acetyl-CoA acetyltransferase [Propionigenium maris DSM 9537]